MRIVNISDRCQTNLISIPHCVQVCFKTWCTWTAMTTPACPTSSKSSATRFRIPHSSPKWKRTTRCFGSSRAVLIDGHLVYPAQKRCAHLLHKEPNSPTFLPLNVLEKIILVERFHNKYIVIGIQAMDLVGGDM